MSRRRLKARRDRRGRPRQAQAKRRQTTVAGRRGEPDTGTAELRRRRATGREDLELTGGAVLFAHDHLDRQQYDTLAGCGKSGIIGPDIGYNPRCVTRCGGRPMRGGDARTEALFSYLSCETRVPLDHPLRPIQKIVDAALGALTEEFEKLYAKLGRPSIAPEKLLRALLLQAFYSVRSERQLMEQLGYNLLFRWFVGCRWMPRCGT